MSGLRRAELSALKARLQSAFAESLEDARADTEGIRYAAWVSVWGRWAIWVATMVEAVYQPELSGGTYAPFILLHVMMVGCNAWVHRLLATGRRVTWSWMLVLSSIDFVLITSSIVSDAGFDNFHYLAYYPALALVAAICPSFVLSLLWTTVVVAFYGVWCLTMGSGLDFAANDEVVLSARLLAMYGVVVFVNVVARYERIRRRRLGERERALLQERVEFSQAIHDTAAQSAYVLGLGIDMARSLAEESNGELKETLAAAYLVSKSLIWDLRRPIDGGLIFGGMELGQALRIHTERFGIIAGVSVEVVQSGDEPPCRSRPGPGSSPWPTTPWPTPCSIPAQTGSGWRWSFGAILYHCPFQITGLVSLMIIPSVAGALLACGRRRNSWAAGSWPAGPGRMEERL